MQDATAVRLPDESWKVVQAALFRVTRQLIEEGQEGMAAEIMERIVPVIEEEVGNSLELKLAREALRSELG